MLGFKFGSSFFIKKHEPKFPSQPPLWCWYFIQRHIFKYIQSIPGSLYTCQPSVSSDHIFSPQPLGQQANAGANGRFDGWREG